MNTNYWYADVDDEVEGPDCWVPVIQVEGCAFSLDVWHASKEDCEAFIRTIPSGTDGEW